MAKKRVIKDAFKNDSSITSVTFGKDCGFVEESAFDACSSLNEINDDNVIEEINKGAFTNTNLYSATFNELTKLGDEVFYNCSNLNSISIPKINSITKGAFKDCKNLESVNINTTDKIEILDNAFEGCTKISNIHLNNCTSIGDYAFKGCENIKQISIDVCEKIGSESFFNCNNLKNVYIYNSTMCELGDKNAFCGDDRAPDKGNYNTYFYVKADLYDDYMDDNNWVYYKDYIRKMVQENQIMYVSNKESNEGKLVETSDDIAGNIKSHEYFEDLNYGLIEFNNTIETLNFEIFTEKSHITSIDLPSKCKVIGSNVFEGYENLEKIEMPKTLTTIGDYAFKDCKKFTSFYIPDSVETLGEGVFAGCENIKKFYGKYAVYNGMVVVYRDMNSNRNKLICVSPNINSKIFNISKISTSININVLGKSCFHGCKNLIRVDIPSIREIHDEAFDGCTNLCEVHFENEKIAPPSLGKDVFISVRDDLKIFVPESRINDYLKEWRNLKYVCPKSNRTDIIYSSETQTSHKKICEGWYKIDNNKNSFNINFFKNNSNITSVIVGENITEIKDESFKNCGSLEYVYLPEKITKMGDRCFYGCRSLKRVHIPSGLKNLYENIGKNNSPEITFGNEIFVRCTALKEFGTYNINGLVTDDKRCYIHNSNNSYTLNFFAQGEINDEYKIITPQYINAIKESAFRGSNITSIEFNSNLSTIGDNAFEGCKYLTSIDNWDNVKTISNGAFKNCKLLGEISLPNNLTSIGENAFENCKEMYIKNTNIPNSVTSIGKYAFCECSKFRCVNNEDKEVPLNLGQNDVVFKGRNFLTHINDCTFKGCKYLTQVNIGSSIESIGFSAFHLKKIGIFNNDDEIKPKNVAGENNVQLLNGIRTLTIKEGSKLKTINKSSFENCTNLNVCSIKLPDSLTDIGEKAFKNCKGYDENSNTPNTLTIPGGITTLGNSCFEETDIENLDISNCNKLSTLPKDGFANCKKLKNIKFLTEFPTNNKIQSIIIDQRTFKGCSNLCSVNNETSGILKLPYYITQICDSAFEGCYNIEKIQLPSKLKTLGHKCFAISSEKDKEVYLEIKDKIDIPMFGNIDSGLNLEAKQGTTSVDSIPFCDIKSDNTLSIDKFIIRVNTQQNNELFNYFKDKSHWSIYHIERTNISTSGGGGGNDNPNTDNFDDTIKPPEV